MNQRTGDSEADEQQNDEEGDSAAANGGDSKRVSDATAATATSRPIAGLSSLIQMFSVAGGKGRGGSIADDGNEQQQQPKGAPRSRSTEGGIMAKGPWKAIANVDKFLAVSRGLWCAASCAASRDHTQRIGTEVSHFEGLLPECCRTSTTLHKNVTLERVLRSLSPSQALA